MEVPKEETVISENCKIWRNRCQQWNIQTDLTLDASEQLKWQFLDSLDSKAKSQQDLGADLKHL